MTDNSYNKWNSYTDKGLLTQIGDFIRHHRLKQNKSQSDIAVSAGISRSTLSLLERGETVTTSTLFQVLRVLDLLPIMDSFKIETTLSPMAIAKAQEKERMRASKSNSAEEPEEDWKW
jgi:transcriptional regulator with XRE-family HTH domain